MDVGEEFVIVTVDIEDLNEFDVDVEGDHFGSSYSPFALKPKESSVEVHKLLTIGRGKHPWAHGTEDRAKVVVLQLWTSLLLQDERHEIGVLDNILKRKRSLVVDEMFQGLVIVFIEESKGRLDNQG